MYDAENVEFKFSRMRRHLKYSTFDQDVLHFFTKKIFDWSKNE